MSSFTEPLDVEYLDGHKWKLLSEFEYHVGTFPSEQVITVPKGFITDFASIPKVFWNVLPPAGEYGKAAVIHDYIYVMGGHIPGSAKTYTKAEADAIFLDAMTILGVGFYRHLMYRMVRWFGRGSFAHPPVSSKPWEQDAESSARV